jgi:4-hydroxy-tetrahydrodipicolinate reductase
MDKIRVVVSGTGFMGREVLNAVCAQEDMEAVGVLEKYSKEEFISLPVPDARLVPLSTEPERLLTELKPDVVVDFTNAEWTREVAPVAVGAGARMVIGTTNLGEAFIDELGRLCEQRNVGSLIAPNFALGAVVMIHLAREAARFFDYAEIVEGHQERKIDSPSGTAVAMARAMVEGHGGPFIHATSEKEPVEGARGGDFEGVSIHSQRMPGFVAHHEIAFGGIGQTLRIRHDSIGRDSFMPGVLLAVREVTKHDRLVIGLDKLLGI